MRSEKEMYDLILGTAKKDNRILAVYMNGSRSNPNVPKDIFQDYDIVYVVTDTESFINDEGWTKIFGDTIVSQEPDKLDNMLGANIDLSRGYTYLMQFTDGNRIDLHLQTLEELKDEYGKDKLTVPLLDKGNYLPAIKKSCDEDYWLKKPSYEEYHCKCNNFWWVAPYCAKGLWRKEILYTISIMNECVRQDLITMITWKAGLENGFDKSMGKANKYLKQYVSDDLWSRLMMTFNMSDYESAWNSLITACELFEETASKVGQELGYAYDADEGMRSFNHIKHIKELPDDAEEIY